MPGLRILTSALGQRDLYRWEPGAERHRVVFLERPEVAAGLRQRPAPVPDGRGNNLGEPELAASWKKPWP
jgi:hypothetical protein